MSEFDKYVGVPYQDKGRNINGADCWGLVRIVSFDLRGIELPSNGEKYSTGTDREEVAKLISGELSDWREVEAGTEKKFDVVLMREGKFPRHIGMVTAPGFVLHVQQGSTSKIERYRSGLLANKIVGFFRCREQE